MSRIFSFPSPPLAQPMRPDLERVTLANGYATGTCPAPSTGSGGAIAPESLSLTDVAITSSYAARNGGGLAWALRRSGQSLTMSNVRIVGNSAGCPSATAGGVAMACLRVMTRLGPAAPPARCRSPRSVRSATTAHSGTVAAQHLPGR